MGMAGIASPVIGLALKSGNNGFVDPEQYVKSSIFAGLAFIARGLTLLVLRGYYIARSQCDTDADNRHLSIAVPVLAPFQHCLRLEKY